KMKTGETGCADCGWISHVEGTDTDSSAVNVLPYACRCLCGAQHISLPELNRYETELDAPGYSARSAPALRRRGENEDSVCQQ
ncbi:hypothetical protein IRJ41_014442, partial [Triplophysa rosa]